MGNVEWILVIRGRRPGRGRGGDVLHAGRHGLDVGGHRRDLIGTVSDLEPGHPWRPVADDATHHFLVPARGLPGEFRSIEARSQCRTGVADAARLFEYAAT